MNPRRFVFPIAPGLGSLRHLAGAALLSAWLAAPASACADQADTLAAIAALEVELLTAFNTSDPQALDRLWDDEFVVVFPNGVQHNKQQRMAALDSTGPIAQYTNLSVQVRTAPGLAIAIVLARVVPGEGTQASAVRLKTTRVWVDRGGRWKILTAQVAQLRDP